MHTIRTYSLFLIASLAVLACSIRIRHDGPDKLSGNALVLLDIQSIHHPTIGAEWDERTGELHSPKLTLVQIGTRDGSRSFFVRGAIDPHDAEMLVRVKEPDPDTQLRFDREP